ncbi:AraC family transcriptional regulator [Nocardiopsis terrae]|uniref:AraC-like DNA-binding protein n=1 Tax=Nocardiopsis terrae TaxID=372655 RepID=A0ABR9HJ47_9ACTN|nr:helix-turn-helix transcriptional regulator [Nocardiopsis terrae]MBE1459050.1 AraC-like DNA-binding protein [Nocardiopsis terrae]GHC87846.1 AraC family transcriptional regulator [Nocardiopsis terrae]
MTDSTTEPSSGRDRLRELLDAVLDEDNARLSEMAGQAHASPFHFSRLFARDTGESPVALRRRVLLERAAWQIGQGTSVTDAAFTAGYGSVEGFTRAFARAFGHPPSATTSGSGRWLPAPNGVHFHPPIHLWVEENPRGRPGMDLTALQTHHDVDDTDRLIALAADLPEQDYRRVWEPGRTVLAWDGPEGSIAAALDRLVRSREVWLASIGGEDFPGQGPDDPASIRARHEAAGARWIAAVDDIGRRNAWGDRLIDALCDPPESFLLGGVVAHVLTYSAHRRQSVRHMLRAAGVEVGHGDPLEWLQERHGAPNRHRTPNERGDTT